MKLERGVELEVLLPVHNEAGSIETVVDEIYRELSPRVAMRFIITEDGSTDGTKDILRRLASSYPMKLIMAEGRKGYGPAVLDGMREAEAPYLLCLDSDGQCDPRDFWKLWASRSPLSTQVGWRTHRRRGLWRRVGSGAFYALYRLMFGVAIHDPSFCYVLAHEGVVRSLLPDLGAMREGFWWEFSARACRRGFAVAEFPVHHRDRRAGTTRVYRPSAVPGMALRHFCALFKIWWETRGRA